MDLNSQSFIHDSLNGFTGSGGQPVKITYRNKLYSIVILTAVDSRLVYL